MLSYRRYNKKGGGWISVAFFYRNKNKEKSNLELAIKFKETTGLNIADYMNGIDPREVYRNSSDCLISIFDREKITKKKIENIFSYYGDRICLEYLNDLYIKNKSILTRNSYGLMEDHVKIYGEDDLKEIVKKYFKAEELSEKEKYILMGILQKIAELVDMYKYRNIVHHERFIKAELDLGIFYNIVVKGKKYTNQQRKKLVKLSQVWDKDTLNKYENLELLKGRIAQISHDSKYLEEINTIQKMEYLDIIYISNDIKEKIQSLYMEYEIYNRENIINRAYSPKKFGLKDVIIDDLSQLGEGAILHFFGIYQKVFSFDYYIYKLEKEYGRKLTSEENESARKKYETKSNNFIPNRSLDLNAIGQSDDGELYNVNTSNQLSCMLIKFENILKIRGTRGNLALGFSKNTLSPDLIATISNRNMHSNKNIEYIETENDFKDFSCNYEELLNLDEAEENTELVMFRNTDLATLKPSYVMYISYRDLSLEEEKRNIEVYKEKMRQAGLEIPFVIFDTYTMNKKMKEIENEER